jgi:hypothetical protein
MINTSQKASIKESEKKTINKFYSSKSKTSYIEFEFIGQGGYGNVYLVKKESDKEE